MAAVAGGGWGTGRRDRARGNELERLEFLDGQSGLARHAPEAANRDFAMPRHDGGSDTQGGFHRELDVASLLRRDVKTSGLEPAPHLSER